MCSQRLRSLLALLLLSVPGAPVRGAPCSSAVGEPSETSGDEIPEISVSPAAKWEPLTRMLICDVINLRDQQFVEEFHEPKENMSNYKENTLPLPHVGARDCSSSNFSKESCLQRISHGLQVFAVYLQFVESEYARSGKAADIKFRTKILSDHVIHRMKNPQLAQELDSDARELQLRALPAASAWDRKSTVHVLLREFASFLKDAYRAIRHVERQARRRPAANRSA
ncbi:interleukin-6 [Megalops cyprinoides]|uniref:interleukin-6 n=1 Tax=Megalops cyprinoides TaxID=118141 RepID=UPI001863A499|nr:interleukin-6 [Megalops cyprinoides]